ncbi:MAG: hypothetical protein D4S02_06860 [Rhodocyclaceae bacterium]|nr:MAG: hypothetical protein D4S02_06860 [Rhodocyclaceae bacterium]
MLLLGVIALVAGLLAGLARLALEVPDFAQAHAGGHGALMIAAFFGTVISLERAVALRRGWPYLGPLCAGLGGVALLADAPWWLPHWLFIAGGGGLTIASGVVMRQQPALYTLTLALGALSWMVGNLVWLAGANMLAAVPWWMAFLVLTIAGERLELTRFLPPRPAATRVFIALLGVIGVGISLSAVGWGAATRLFGLGLLGLACWLLRYDIARKTVHQSGLTRFVAVCLLSGYAWLAASGLLGLGGAYEAGHVWRDAALHAVFLGFVFSMVIGHAPIIFPAVMRVKIPYHPVFYIPLAALHLSLLARVAGDLAGIWPLRQWAGMANAAALLLFVLTLLASVLRGALARAPEFHSPQPPQR